MALVKPLKNILNNFGPWTAFVQGPLLKLRMMNVITTALNDRPVKNRRVTSWLCDLFGWPPEVAHARADALATPGEGTGPTGWMLPTCRPGPLTRRRSAAPLAPRAPRLRSLSPFKAHSCHSCHSWAPLTRKFIKLHQTKSNHRNYERSTQRQNRTLT